MSDGVTGAAGMGRLQQVSFRGIRFKQPWTRAERTSDGGALPCGSDHFAIAITGPAAARTLFAPTNRMVSKLSVFARRFVLLLGLFALAGCSDGSTSEDSGPGPVAAKKQDQDQADVADRQRRSIHHR